MTVKASASFLTDVSVCDALSCDGRCVTDVNTCCLSLPLLRVTLQLGFPG
jgi:hypothetical protein